MVDTIWNGNERTLERLMVKKGAAKLDAIDVHTPRELLRYYPRKYLHWGTYTPLSQLREGERVSVMARVVSASARAARHQRGLYVISILVTDGKSQLPVVKFQHNKWAVDQTVASFKPGTPVMLSGVMKKRGRELQLAIGNHQVLEEILDPEIARKRAETPLPVYAATADVESETIKAMVRLLLDPLATEKIPDPLPAPIRKSHKLVDLATALRMIHAPENDGERSRARKRLAYEEAFVLQVALARKRADEQSYEATPRPKTGGGLLAALDAQLPFELTQGQREVGEQISADLARSVPMLRLLQGEVGSGKTVVALRAMAQVIDAGGQAALLAPTEVLAYQHAYSLRRLLGSLAEGGMLTGSAHSTRIALLTGSLDAAHRRQALADAAGGGAGIIVGTHALLSETVSFADLGLAVIDEQHRFGVNQREALREKGRTMPHQLFLSATPIPRSVAMTFFGDVDVSSLKEVPAGRTPVRTFVVPEDNDKWMARLWQRVGEQIAAGGRAFVVAPRIEDAGEDDPRGLKSVEAITPRLAQIPALANIATTTLHGRMSAEDKEAAMADFASGKAPLMVATTVIEVGVDVPEATVMVILDADMFGLSQLHQLRGRVGRSSKPGICFLVTNARPGSPAMERLEVMESTQDGFTLAEKDLEMRREGDVLGKAQSGRGSSLRLLSVIRDRDLIDLARHDARELIKEDPHLRNHPEVLEAITELVDPDHEEFLDRA